MRHMFMIFFALFSLAAHAQNMQPKIVGQKALFTNEGTALTIRLTDLFVEETPVQDGDDDDNESGDHDGDDSNGGDNSGSEDDEGDEGDKGDTGDKGDAGDNGDKGHKGDKEDKWDKG